MQTTTSLIIPSEASSRWQLGSWDYWGCFRPWQCFVTVAPVGSIAAIYASIFCIFRPFCINHLPNLTLQVISFILVKALRFTVECYWHGCTLVFPRLLVNLASLACLWKTYNSKQIHSRKQILESENDYMVCVNLFLSNWSVNW